MGKNFPIPMLGREFAKSAGAVVDTKLPQRKVTRKGVVRVLDMLVVECGGEF